MRSLKILLAICILSAGVFAQSDTRSSATWRVNSYDLNVNIPTDGRDIAIKAALTVRNVSNKPASSLTLRLSPDASVSAVALDGASVDFTRSEEKTGMTGTLQRLLIRPPAVAAGMTAIVSVDYKLKIGDNSGIASLTSSNSQLLPLSYWYPTPNSWYFSKGPDMAAFKVKVNQPSGQISISSGSEIGGAFDQKLKTEPFFLTGAWDVMTVSGITFYLPKDIGQQGKARAEELATYYNDAIKFASSYFGQVPTVPLRVVAVRRGAGFSGGGTVLVDEAFFRRPGIDSLTAMNVADAAARLWIGGKATPSGEGFGVAGEGLPKYIATQFLESKYGKETADVERMRQRIAYFGDSKRDTAMSVVSPLDEYFYTSVANKGAMLWRLLEIKSGKQAFSNILKSKIDDGDIDLAGLRQAFYEQKDLVDYMLDKTTDMNLLIGVPTASSGGWTMALRNSGTIDANVMIGAVTESGEKLSAPAAIKAQSFGEITFKSNSKIVRAEIDTDKLYPQVEYSDDIAPRESTDSDPILGIKRLYDTQNYNGAVKLAKSVLLQLPRADEARLILARSLLALDRLPEAEKEFKTILTEKLPAARSIAWANVGLGEIAAKNGQNDQALSYASNAIVYDAEYGAGYSARSLRSKLNAANTIDPSIKSFFTDFDKAVSAKRKSDIDAMIVPGEITKFASGVAGSAEMWQSVVKNVDKIDQNTALAEVALSLRLINKDAESGTAVFRMVRYGNGWRILGVDVFEVR